MKTYEVEYVRGHFIDKKSQNQIILKGGGSFLLIGNEYQFEECEELVLDSYPLNSEKKKEALSKVYHNYVLLRIAKENTDFFYRVGLRKHTPDDRIRKEYFFDATILEDLYIYTKDGVSWSLCPCLCETKECLFGNIKLTENVHGESLNNLFSNVITSYFPMQRSTACNAFTTFLFLDKEKFKNVKNPVYNYPKYSLNKERKHIAFDIFEVDNN